LLFSALLDRPVLLFEVFVVEVRGSTEKGIPLATGMS
jgi:hypothetical protein